MLGIGTNPILYPTLPIPESPSRYWESMGMTTLHPCGGFRANTEVRQRIGGKHGCPIALGSRTRRNGTQTGVEQTPGTETVLIQASYNIEDDNRAVVRRSPSKPRTKWSEGNGNEDHCSRLSNAEDLEAARKHGVEMAPEPLRIPIEVLQSMKMTTVHPCAVHHTTCERREASRRKRKGRQLVRLSRKRRNPERQADQEVFSSM